MPTLNPDQQAVIRDFYGARSVEAGPGSGKTTTMVELIQALRTAGVSSADIKAVTFTKEMASALEKKLGVTGIASTFHSLGYMICSEIERKPVEPEIRHRLMCRLVRKWGRDYKELDHFIAQMRRENISPAESYEAGSFDYGLCSAYTEYENERATGGWMDFDSMMHDSVQLLENAQNRARWQPKFMIVDEAQDTDNAQWRMMQLMTEKHGNITVVGDPNQAIYGFRGAKPENLRNIETWFPSAKKFYLGLNYRSTEAIVNFGRENAPKGTPKEMLARMKSFRGVKGAPIGLKMYWSDEAEAESALALAQRDPLRSVILARTNHVIGMLERLCYRYKIRFHLLGRTGFWKQNEIRKAIEAIKAFPTSTTDAALNMVLPNLESKYAVNDRTERDNDALENLKALRTYGQDFRMAKEFAVWANKMMHRRNDPYGVTISTVHQAKGGEWKNVFLIGVNSKGFPHPKGDEQEEARIYYVAITRPTDVLRISFAGTPSVYLRKYLTDEILDRLRAHAEEVERLQEQPKLFA